MASTTGSSTGPHPFITHLVATLSVYEVGPPTAPVPVYNGPSDWCTDTILRSLAAMARRMYTAEEAWNAIKASENCGPDTKKRRSVGDSPPLSSASSSSLSDLINLTNSTPYTSSGAAPPSYFTPSSSLDSIPDSMVDLSVKDGSDDFEMLNHDSEPTPSTKDGSARAASPMRIPLDGVPIPSLQKGNGADNGLLPDAAHTQHHSYCAGCGRPMTGYSQMAMSSPMVIPPNGALAAAAFESGISAVEELRLLKAQVQDVARVCNAVACGDLSQKITVPVHGDVMVQLKEVINGMVRFHHSAFVYAALTSTWPISGREIGSIRQRGHSRQYGSRNGRVRDSRHRLYWCGH